MTDSISRRLAQFVRGLSFDDLPPEVVDKAKALTLHSFGTALVNYSLPETQRAISLIKEEESVRSGGSTILVDGTRATKVGAAYANYEMFHGQGDTYRMLTHPGETIFPGALAVLEGAEATGQEFITAIVAGYEVQERLTGEFVPSVMARGFHAGPAFGIFGPAVAAGKLLRFDEEQMSSTIALCVSLAGGNLEGTRSGGRTVREGGSVRNAMLAVLLARDGMRGGETTIEGDAGFYHSFVGNNKGKLTYAFGGRKTNRLSTVTADLGSRWEVMDTVHKTIPTGGYNMPHVEVTARLCADNDIAPEDVEKVELVVNWLETQNPSPAFPRPRSKGPRVGGSEYYAAYGVVRRDYPADRRRVARSSAGGDPPEVLDMMKKVHIIPSKTQTVFGPKVAIHTKDGRVYRAEATGREFMWDLAEERQRVRELVPLMPIPSGRFEELLAAASGLEALDRADRLIELTLAQ